MDAFRDEFYPVAEAEAAMVKLENSEYFQRSGESVDAYVNCFPGTCEESEARRQGSGRHQVPMWSCKVAAHHPLGFPVPALYFRC